VSDQQFKRVLLKLGGESLSEIEGGEAGGGVIVQEAVSRTADHVVSLRAHGAEIAIVLGGGNLMRGAKLAGADLQRTTADGMGMLATVINALALGDAIQARGVEARVMTPFSIGGLTERFSSPIARRYLDAGFVVLLAGGTGNPFFTTDTNAALRAAEVGAHVVVKATKVDGVYSADPMKDPDAVRYERLTYREVIDRNLGVMDITAITLCMETNTPVVVCDLWQDGALAGVLAGDTSMGTWIGN